VPPALEGAVTGLWVLLAALVVATAVGLTLRYRDGRFRPARRARKAPAAPPSAPATRLPAPAAEPAAAAQRDPAAEPPPTGSLATELAVLGKQSGERATLLQFSSAFCAPCRSTRGVLADVARIVPGVAHVEVDAEAHLDLVRRLGIRRTPTVLVLDGAGRELSRASGAAPSRAAVIAALGAAVDGAVPGGGPFPAQR
jgi:thiol-disulfide isomerase/thioredoxin